MDTAVFREGRSGDEGRLVPLRFTEDGDGYAARIDTSRFADHHGNLRLYVRLEYAPGQFHDESLRMVALMMEDFANGIAIDAPPTPSSPARTGELP